MTKTRRAALFIALWTTPLPTTFGAQTYIYELIPGNSTIGYFGQIDGENREVFSRVRGRLQFSVENEAVTGQSFRLLFDGVPFDRQGVPILDAPFQAGDALSEFLDVDFGSAVGLAPRGPDPSLPPAVSVGPQVEGDYSAMFLGLNFYRVFSLKAETFLEVRAAARPEFGGEFRLYPHVEQLPPDENGVWVPVGVMVPNLILVPEPAAFALAALASPVLMRRRMFD